MTKELDDSVVISLPERFHNEQAVAMGKKINELLNQSRDIILDFCDVDYIDSSGVTVLMFANKLAATKARKLLLRGMNNEVRTFFSLTCLDKVFKIE